MSTGEKKGPGERPASGGNNDGGKDKPKVVIPKIPPGTPALKVKDVGTSSGERAASGASGRGSAGPGPAAGPNPGGNPGVSNQANFSRATNQTTAFGALTQQLGMGNLTLIKDSFNLMEKIFGRSQAVLEAISEYGSSFYDPLQKAMGGIQDISNISNETSKAQFDALNSIYDVYYENMEGISLAQNNFMVETATAAKENVNALFAYFREPEEITRSYGRVVSNLKEEQILRLNELSEAEKVYLGTFEKGFNVSSSKIAKVMQRNIALTGEASVDIFGEISNFSAAVAEKTGVDYKQISGITMDIITDVQRFGNVQVEEAARIAGALTELGISYSTFGSMVDRFMNFDSAASSLGNLTTLFGVHFDAMEMMMLANEDQEEFLYRIREAFLETGKSIEDMTLAEKKLAASELGMDVTAFENFMRAERDITDTTAATREASEKGMKEGFETMTQNMVLVNRNMGEMEKYMQGKLLNPLKESAYQTHIELSLVNSNMKELIDDSKELNAVHKRIRGDAEGTMIGDAGIRRDIAKEIADDYRKGDLGSFTGAQEQEMNKYIAELQAGTTAYTERDFRKRLKAAGVSEAKTLELLGRYRTQVFTGTEKEKKLGLDSAARRKGAAVSRQRISEQTAVAEAQRARGENLAATYQADVIYDSNLTGKQAADKLILLNQQEQEYRKKGREEEFTAIKKALQMIVDKGGVKAGEPVTLFFENTQGERIRKEIAGGSVVDLGTGFRLQGSTQ